MGISTQSNNTPSKSVQFSDILQKCHTQSGWNGTGQEYISTIRKTLEDPAYSVKIRMHHLSDDAVVFVDGSNNAIILINESEVLNLNSLITESKLFKNSNLFHNQFPNGTLLTAITCNRAMFERPNQMANMISLIFSANEADIKSNFDINSFNDSNTISFNTNLSDVQRFFEAKAVSPVIPGNFGFIAMSNSNPSFGRDPIPLFAVLGNVEFLKNESTKTFTPIVRINEIISTLPTTKIYALALPLIAEAVISRNLWKQPFTAYGKDTSINVGNLVIDAGTQKPYEVKSESDYQMMFLDYIEPYPMLCIDIKSGGADIPGIHRLIGANYAELYKEIISFFNDNTDLKNYTVPQLAMTVFHDIIGFVDVKQKSGLGGYTDTRDFTYLYTVSRLKYQPQFDFLKSRAEVNIQQRFDRVREIFGEITPTHYATVALLNNAFLMDMVSRIAGSRLRIENFQSQEMSINLTKFTQYAYQPNGILFGNPNTTSNNNFYGWMRP